MFGGILGTVLVDVSGRRTLLLVKQNLKLVSEIDMLILLGFRTKFRNIF